MSKAESGGGEGVEIVANEPYEDEERKGQYTHKVIPSYCTETILALSPRRRYPVRKQTCRVSECLTMCFLLVMPIDLSLGVKAPYLDQIVDARWRNQMSGTRMECFSL